MIITGITIPFTREPVATAADGYPVGITITPDLARQIVALAGSNTGVDELTQRIQVLNEYIEVQHAKYAALEKSIMDLSHPNCAPRRDNIAKLKLAIENWRTAREILVEAANDPSPVFNHCIDKIQTFLEHNKP